MLIVERDLSDEDLHGLVQRIDDDLVLTADQAREDFLVTVYRGSELGVFRARSTESRSPSPESRFPNPESRSFRIVHGARFTHHRHLDLPGILELIFDLARDLV